MKRKKPTVSKRNPIAKAVTKLRPKVVPDIRRKKLSDAKKREANDTIKLQDD